MRAITLDEAVAVIKETFAEAKRRNAYPLTAVLLDAGGHVKAAMKQDGASLLRFEVAYGKAYAALAMGRQSRLVLQKAKEKPLFMQSLLDLATGPMFLEGGGQLIRDDDGEVIGALATTGDTNEVDDLCAIAGIRERRLQDRRRLRRQRAAQAQPAARSADQGPAESRRQATGPAAAPRLSARRLLPANAASGSWNGTGTARHTLMAQATPGGPTRAPFRPRIFRCRRSSAF